MEIVSVIGSDLFKYFSRPDGAFIDKPIFAGSALFYDVVFEELCYNGRDHLDAALLRGSVQYIMDCVATHDILIL
jgi:hypothetical protein